MWQRGVAQSISDDARLDGDRPALDIYFEASVEVAGGIDNHPITNSVAGHRGATASANHAPIAQKPRARGHGLCLRSRPSRGNDTGYVV